VVPVLVPVQVRSWRERERLTSCTDRGMDGLENWGAVKLQVFDLVLGEEGRKGRREKDMGGKREVKCESVWFFF